MLKFIQKRRGAGLVEYGLVVGLISVVAILAVTNVGSNADSLFSEVGDTLATVSPGSETATPSPSATPAGTSTRYWRFFSDPGGDSDSATSNDNSIGELQFYFNGGFQTLATYFVRDDSIPRQGSVGSAFDGIAPTSNSNYYNAELHDYVFDLGSSQAVTQIRMAPQGASGSPDDCYNVPLSVTIYSGSAELGPWTEVATITTATVTPYGDCPSGWSLGGFTDFTVQ